MYRVLEYGFDFFTKMKTLYESEDPNKKQHGKVINRIAKTLSNDAEHLFGVLLVSPEKRHFRQYIEYQLLDNVGYPHGYYIDFSIHPNDDKILVLDFKFSNVELMQKLDKEYLEVEIEHKNKIVKI
jgi:hypothetical protein